MPKPTKSEQEHYKKVVEIGCIVCRECLGIYDSPCEIHHLIGVAGLGKKASNDKVIPLCSIHHRLGNRGVAVHSGKVAWEENFQTQERFLEIVNDLI